MRVAPSSRTPVARGPPHGPRGPPGGAGHHRTHPQGTASNMARGYWSYFSHHVRDGSFIRGVQAGLVLLLQSKRRERSSSCLSLLLPFMCQHLPWYCPVRGGEVGDVSMNTHLLVARSTEITYVLGRINGNTFALHHY